MKVARKSLNFRESKVLSVHKLVMINGLKTIKYCMTREYIG